MTTTVPTRPDLTRWNRFDEFTLHEAICLWLNLEPHHTSRHVDGYKHLELAMKRAYRANHLLLNQEISNLDGTTFWLEDDDLYWGDVTLSRVSLATWAIRNGETPAFLELGIAQLKLNIKALVADAQSRAVREIVLSFPEAVIDTEFPKVEETPAQSAVEVDETYTTDLLDLLIKAKAEFWDHHDPDNPPKKEKVVAWIVARMGKVKSAILAKYMDSIIRSEVARRGGNPDNRQKKTNRANEPKSAPYIS
jgi:hypothetical protein